MNLWMRMVLKSIIKVMLRHQVNFYCAKPCCDYDSQLWFYNKIRLENTFI